MMTVDQFAVAVALHPGRGGARAGGTMSRSARSPLLDVNVGGSTMTQHEQFRVDMAQAGYRVREYQGRNFWRGPAVSCDREELQDVIRATKVRVQTDSLGLGLIVYPVATS